MRWYYHLSPRENRASIIADGLIPKSLFGPLRCTYLYTARPTDENYAEIAALHSVDPDSLDLWRVSAYGVVDSQSFFQILAASNRIYPSLVRLDPYRHSQPTQKEPQ